MKSIAQVKEDIQNSFFNSSLDSFQSLLETEEYQAAFKAYPELLIYSKHHQHMAQIDYSFIQEDSLLNKIYSDIYHLSSHRNENYEPQKAHDYVEKTKIFLQYSLTNNPKIEILQSALDFSLNENKNFNHAFHSAYYDNLVNKQNDSIYTLLLQSIIDNKNYDTFLDKYILNGGLLDKIEKKAAKIYGIESMFSPIREVKANLYRLLKHTIVRVPYSETLMSYENKKITTSGFKSSLIYKIANQESSFSHITLKNYLNKYQGKFSEFDNRGKNLAYYFKKEEDTTQILQSYGLEPKKLSGNFSFKKLILNCAFWSAREQVENKNIAVKQPIDFIESTTYKIRIFNPELQNTHLNQETKNVLLQALGLMTISKNKPYDENTHFLKHDVLTSYFNNAKEISELFKTEVGPAEKNMVLQTFQTQTQIIKEKLISISTNLITDLASTKINEIEIQNKVLTLKASR